VAPVPFLVFVPLKPTPPSSPAWKRTLASFGGGFPCDLIAALGGYKIHQLQIAACGFAGGG
jgi:hypothetical protein